MDVPSHLFSTAWYELGPRPGELGSAVIAGHLDGYHGLSAVFADLYKLKRGDKIATQDEDGAVANFVVGKSRLIGVGDDSTGVFVSSDGKAHLNLVTCAGTWDRRAAQYDKRLVVFADRVN